MMTIKNSSISSVRRLVSNYQAIALDRCLNSQLEKGNNECIQSGNSEEIAGLLAKAGFISALISQGYDEKSAFRELGKRMRALAKM